MGVGLLSVTTTAKASNSNYYKWIHGNNYLNMQEIVSLFVEFVGALENIMQQTAMVL